MDELPPHQKLKILDFLLDAGKNKLHRFAEKIESGKRNVAFHFTGNINRRPHRDNEEISQTGIAYRYKVHELKGIEEDVERVERLLKEVCEARGDKIIPALYFRDVNYHNAYANSDMISITMNLGAVRGRSDEQIKSTIGHELHHLYQDKTIERAYRTVVEKLNYWAGKFFIGGGLAFVSKDLMKESGIPGIKQAGQVMIAADGFSKEFYVGAGLLFASLMAVFRYKAMQESRTQEFEADIAGAEVAGFDAAIDKWIKEDEDDRAYYGRKWVSKVVSNISGTVGYVAALVRDYDDPHKADIPAEEVGRKYRESAEEFVYKCRTQYNIFSTHPIPRDRVQSLIREKERRESGVAEEEPATRQR